jgi:nucleoside-diphosphate-sugar epimerase
MEKDDPAVQIDVQRYLESGGLPFGNCAIFGANGMLSSYIIDFISVVNALHGENSRIFGFARSSSNFTKNLQSRSNIRMFHLSEIDSLLQLDNVNIFHAASPSSLSDLRKNKQALIESNIKLTTSAHALLEKIGGRFTFFSSGEVYGHAPRIPTNESDYSFYDHLSVEGYYAETKRFSEMLSQIWSDKTRLPVTILRIFHTFGPGIRRGDSRIFASAIFEMQDSNKIYLNSNGLATRSFLYSADLVSAISTTSNLNGFQVFNVGGEEEITILDFAKIIARFGLNCEIFTTNSAMDSVLSNNKITRGLADTSKLKSLGWNPKVSITEAIALTIQSNKWREENQLL